MLHIEELNDLHSSPNIVRVIKSRRKRWAGRVARMGREEAYTGFWCGKLKEREHLEDPGWMDLQEVGCGGMDWIDVTQDRNRWWALVSAVMKLRVP
jgi:hypothetical protein